MTGAMLFSSMKATLKFLVERIESIFLDSIMIELDLNDDKSEFAKVVVLRFDRILRSRLFLRVGEDKNLAESQLYIIFSSTGKTFFKSNKDTVFFKKKTKCFRAFKFQQLKNTSHSVSLNLSVK